jgi:flagellar motor switch protein FliM
MKDCIHVHCECKQNGSPVFVSSAPFCSPQQKKNVLDQNDVVLVDSLGTNRIYFHRNMSLGVPFSTIEEAKDWLVE